VSLEDHQAAAELDDQLHSLGDQAAAELGDQLRSSDDQAAGRRGDQVRLQQLAGAGCRYAVRLDVEQPDAVQPGAALHE